jgi:excisionase family DNA binding protein
MPKFQDQKPKTQDLLTVAQAAGRLGIGPSAVRTYCQLGRLPAQRIGRDWLIRAAAVDAFVRRPAHRPAKS